MLDVDYYCGAIKRKTSSLYVGNPFCAYLYQLGHSNLFFSINNVTFERLNAISMSHLCKIPKECFPKQQKHNSFSWNVKTY